jgi:superfamily II DNA/RNA helicase
MMPTIQANVAREAQIVTDEWIAYGEIGCEFASHEPMNYGSDEYVRREGDKVVTTKKGRGLLFDLQARDEGRLPELWRETPTPLSGEVRFPLFEPHQARRQRRNARSEGHPRRKREAADVSTA